MNTFARTVAAVAGLLLLAACGSDNTTDTQAADSPPTSQQTTSSSTPAPADDTVTSVTLRRSGGLKGQSVDRAFVVGQAAPDGFTAADQDKVIETAQRFADAGITVPDLPDNTCCDRYTYTVVIGFADATSTTFTALDGERTPAAFSRLLRQLS